MVKRHSSGTNGGLRDEARAVPVTEVAEALEAAGAGFRLFGRGNGLRARCLTKGEADTKPSLRIWTAKNRWKCFSCGEHGDGIELVERVLGFDFLTALGWMKERFGLNGGPGAPTGGAIAPWAKLRGITAASLASLGVEDAGGGLIRFPMRLERGSEVVGWKQRRADNTPVAGGAKSICEKGSSLGLFIPENWPMPNGGSALVICEGEADAAAALSAGLPFAVGTADKNWRANDSCRGALVGIRKVFPGRAVLVAHGDVEDSEALAQAALLEAELVRVPLYVSAEPTERDLNEWLVREGPRDVKERILNTRAFTALYKSAVDEVVEAVRRTSVLQRRHVAPLRAAVLYLLQNVMPKRRRDYKGVSVGPDQWVMTRAALAEHAGVSEQTARTLIDKLVKAGFIKVEVLGGRRGQLATVQHLSAYIKLTGRPSGAKTLDKGAGEEAAKEGNRTVGGTGREAVR